MFAKDLLQGIDEEISRREEILEQLKVELRTLKTRRNTLSPISMLPIELLGQIFIDSRDRTWDLLLWEDNQPCWSWLNVTAVCTRWRFITLNLPSFWNRLRLRDSELEDKERCLELFRKSRSTPLDLSVLYHGRLSSPFDDSASFWGRVRRFQLILYHPIPVDVLLVKAPLLEELSLSFRTISQISLPSTVFFQEAPALRRVELSLCKCGTLVSVLPPLPHLTRLIIHPELSQVIPLSLFASSLRRMPKLEYISVSRLQHLHSLEPSPILLPCLATLCMIAEKGNVASFFDLLQCPSTTVITFDCCQHIDETTDLPSLTNLCSRLRASETSSPIRQLALGWGKKFFFLVVSTNDASLSPRLSLSIPSNPESNVAFNQLCSSLPLSTIPTLTIEYATGYQPNNLLQPFEQVEVLRLVGCDTSVFSGLKPPLQASPLLPHLRVLILADCDLSGEIVTELLSVLAERKAKGGAIDRLSIEGCDVSQDVVAALRELVNVDWDEEPSAWV